MTPSGLRDEGKESQEITTRAEFETALERVVATARDGDAPLKGAYDVRSPWLDEPDYTIEITEQAKRVPDGED